MKQRQRKKYWSRWQLTVSLFLFLFAFSGCTQNSAQQTPVSVDSMTLQTDDSSLQQPKTSSMDYTALMEETSQQLANLDYEGEQTINVNNGVPFFTQTELSLENGAWEHYGDLDDLNRVTTADAMLNQRLMPTTKRESIANVKPTGWHNKQLKKGTLYNRTHLIGFALAGENANWKNLMTGTQQLNNPEMLRFEMDIKYYLEQDPEHYVRYSVNPVFKENELVARGVQMQAQSINDDAISFNIYIFNIQDGVVIDYATGTSVLSDAVIPEKETETTSDSDEASEQVEEKQTEYIDQNGHGLIKGSNNGVYHLPGSQYYDSVTNPKEWFKTIEEAEKAGYREPKK